MSIPRYGVALQLNPALLDWFPFLDQPLDALEILFDSFMAPLDGPGLMLPGMINLITEVSSRFPLLGHSNYGGDFGFEDLTQTSAVLRHSQMAQRLNVPWVSNHCFYSDSSWCDVWSSPLQFSPAEVIRIADRARALQDYYGVPLAHENAAYYRLCPGSTMREEDFITSVIQRSNTYLHLDLHNLYANELNHRENGYSIKRFIDTIPLERVICIHLAGGRWHDNQYHDLHDTQVPEPVWELLDEVLSRSHPGAIIIEYETEALRYGQEILDKKHSIDLILADLERARGAWDRAYGVASRRTTKQTI